jgi:hypothetical protein
MQPSPQIRYQDGFVRFPSIPARRRDDVRGCITPGVASFAVRGGGWRTAPASGGGLPGKARRRSGGVGTAGASNGPRAVAAVAARRLLHNATSTPILHRVDLLYFSASE